MSTASGSTTGRGHNPSRRGGPGKSRASIPTWLGVYYADLVVSLETEIKCNPSHRPSCYDRGSFFIHGKRPIFATDHILQLYPHMFYLPDFFIWLPHLFVSKIPCPACLAAKRTSQKKKTINLHLHGWVQHPRRVIDLDSNVWLAGRRYHCDHPDCKKTYQSWSPAILNVLPKWLSDEFPFHLTHRCGLSDRLVALLRSSFQRGIGPSPFTKMIQLFHVRKYEQLHVQYIEMISSRLSIGKIGSAMLVKHKPFGMWDDIEGYAGFVPTHNYFTNFYNTLIEKHSREIDQHMAMLPARILCIDHSHKVSSDSEIKLVLWLTIL